MAGRTVAVAAAGWSTNVGNAFFNIGCHYLLEQVFPDDQVVFLCDQDAYWDVRTRTTPRNALGLLKYIRPDYLVLNGCFLTTRFRDMWEETIRALRERGTRFLYLSAGMNEYSQQEIEHCRRFMAEYPPFVFATRDSTTFEHFKDLAEFAYDGIDAALFVNDAVTPLKMDAPPFIVLNFDKLPEPLLAVEDGPPPPAGFASRSARAYQFEFQGRKWTVEFPRVRSVIARWFGKFYPYIEGPLLPKGPLQPRVGGFEVFRADHQVNPLVLSKIFRRPRTFVSDLPYGYLTLYANAALTLSDRVHACVASMSYGTPAMLFARTGRAGLLERAGAATIRERPTLLAPEKIEAEKERLLAFLRSVPFA